MILQRTMKIAAAIGASAACAATAARAQSVDVERPRSLVVGSPSIGAGVASSNAAQTGVSTVRLPVGSLRTEWQASLGVSVESAPAVDSHGNISMVGDRGDFFALSSTGEEIMRLATGFAQPGPCAVLPDDTVVFVDANAEAVAVRDRRVRWHTKFARASAGRPAPLALDDGGVIVAAGDEVALLDSEGHERSRVVLPEPASALVATTALEVAIVTTGGAIWTWKPGAMEAIRAVSFDGPIDSSAVAASGPVLLAVAAGGARLVAANLVEGTMGVRASASAGSVWLGPPAARGDGVSLLALTGAGELALAFDGGGREVGRAWVGSPAFGGADGGASPDRLAPRVGPLVDSNGTLAFAAADGAVGVIARLGSMNPAVDRLPDVCPPSLGTRLPPDSSVVGLAPLRPDAFLVACRSGMVLAIRGDRG